MESVKKILRTSHYLRSVLAGRLKEIDMKKGSFTYFQLRGVMAVLLGTALLSLTAGPGFAQQRNPERNAYFGETHVHTSWSLDAFSIGNTITNPGDAYKYFKGEPIKHPLGFEVKIDTPLDWAGVTDHSEYAGVVQLANDPSSPISKLPAAQPLILKAKTKEEMTRVALYAINTLASGPPVKELMAPEAEQHEPPPQHLLQGLRQGATDALQRPGLVPSRGSLELDGRPAEGRQRPPRDFAQCKSLRRPHVSDRGRHQGPPDRRRLCRIAYAQRAADRDQAAQGHLGDEIG